MSIAGILEYCTFDINNSQAIQSSQNCIVCIKLIEGGSEKIYLIYCVQLYIMGYFQKPYQFYPDIFP